VRHVVSGHRGHREDRDAAGAVEVDGLFVPRRKIAVQGPGVAQVRGDLVHRDRDFLHGIREGRHVRQEDEHPLSLDPEMLGHGQRHVRHEQTFDDRVGRRVNEHDRAGQNAGLLEGAAELEVLVVLEANAAQDDDVRIGAHPDARQQVVVGLAGRREYGKLLALDERVEDIDHGHARFDEIARDDTLHRVDGGAADIDPREGGQRRTPIDGFARTVEDPPQDRVSEDRLHRMSEKTHLVARGYAPRA